MKNFTFILFTVFLHSGNCQNTSIKTNVDLTSLSPKWFYVNSVELNNKDLKFVNSISEWDRSYEKSNPMLIMKNESGLLVNYYVIRDINEICPVGYRVPLISDFNSLKSKNITFIKNVNDENDFLVRGSNSIIRGNEEIDGIYSYYSETNNFGFWVKDEISEKERILYDDMSGKSEGMAKSILIKRKVYTNSAEKYDNNFFFVNISNRQDGLNLMCVEMADKVLRDTSILYSDILPKEYDNLISEISKNLENSKKNEFHFSAQLKFDSYGNNISDSFSDLDEQSNLPLYNALKKVISEWNVYPYYNDIKVKSYQSIDILHFSYSENVKRKKQFNNKVNFENMNLSKSLQDDMFNCYQGKRDFNFSTEKISSKTKINGEIKSSTDVEVMKKIIGKGPMYSLYSIVPGLGKMQITKESNMSHEVAYTRKLKFYLGTSISLGVIGATAKLLSNYYYDQYKRGDVNGLANNYKIANISQKVFLSCLYSYGAMFIWDFSSTFAIGVGNKILQRKVNKNIRQSNFPVIVN